MTPSAEITVRGVLLAIILAIVLSASNTFLALKIGFVTSASIPASILAMGILRFFKRSNILENNMVQTGASAGEAVAVGVVFTVPALIIIHYWLQFNYWDNFAIALVGGILGVLLTIPLRKVLVTSKELPFPEGNAVAHVLQANHKKALGLREMLLGGAVGGVLEFAQSGLNFIASSAQAAFSAGKMLFGFGVGFSATLIGAGYLIGFSVGISLLIGALITWVICVPLLSLFADAPLHGAAAVHSAVALYTSKVRYIGIGAMLIAGLCTLLTLVKPIYNSFQQSLRVLQSNTLSTIVSIANTDRDIPIRYMLLGIGLLLITLYLLFSHLFNFTQLSVATHTIPAVIIGSLVYVLIIGFIFATICAYFSGLIGVSASPVSSIIIMSVLLMGLVLKLVLGLFSIHLTHEQTLPLEGIAIIIGSIVIGAASITNDNIQDLKVGHMVGSTPWKQQIMLLIGVVAAASVIPLILNLLFHAYGIAGVMPHPGMNPADSFAAPPAAMMATITQGIFSKDLPWRLFVIGAGIIIFVAIINLFLRPRGKKISLLGIALGIYLPLAYSTPLFIGALIAYMAKRHARTQSKEIHNARGTLIACGLVAGAALMDILLAIPMGLARSPDVLNIMPADWTPIATILGGCSIVGLGVWFYRVAKNSRTSALPLELEESDTPVL